MLIDVEQAGISCGLGVRVLGRMTSENPCRVHELCSDYVCMDSSREVAHRGLIHT